MAESFYYKKHKINNIIPQYGIYQQNKVITWIYASDGLNLHGSNPEYKIMFMIFLMQQYRKNNRPKAPNTIHNPP